MLCGWKVATVLVVSSGNLPVGFVTNVSSQLTVLRVASAPVPLYDIEYIGLTFDVITDVIVLLCDYKNFVVIVGVYSTT